MNSRIMRNRFNFVLLIYMLFNFGNAFAIDNPDAPNYVDEFLSRDQAYESNLRKTGNATKDYLPAYRHYEAFLDKELNHAYRLLMARIDAGSKSALMDSQRKWLTYRDSEFAFISQNWTQKNFGSSYVISRGDYRATIIRHRIISLLYYLQNYIP